MLFRSNGYVSSVRVILEVDADDGDVGEECILAGGETILGLLVSGV